MFTQVGSRLEHFVEEKTKADKVLDVRGWSCRWSILKAKSELKRMEPGQVLEVLSTDPLTLNDFPAILRKTDDEVIRVNEGLDFFSLYVRKGNSRAARSLSGSHQDLEEL
jgi:TusA-related sulfurtransferase